MAINVSRRYTWQIQSQKLVCWQDSGRGEPVPLNMVRAEGEILHTIPEPGLESEGGQNRAASWLATTPGVAVEGVGLGMF